MSKVASELRRLSLGPGDVARNARLGLWMLLLGGGPVVALVLSVWVSGADSAGYPLSPVFWVLLVPCMLALPVMMLGIVAVVLALATKLFWRRQAQRA
jgi:hypothetical protein